MPITIAIGLIAGFAAAAMLVSAAQGPSLAGFLLSLTSMLPIFLARLGWGSVAGLIAAITGAAVFSLIATPAAGGVWLLSQAVPVLLLSHYVTLSRHIPGGQVVPMSPAAANDQDGPGKSTAAAPQQQVEWYPVGRVVAIAGAIGGALASLSMLVIGQDVDAIKESIKTILPAYIKKFPQLSQQNLSDERLTQIADIAVYVLPVATAIVCVMILLLNLWLAARITRASGRLQRPWPDIAAMQIPAITALGLAVALLATYAGGMPGLMATAFTGAFLFVYVCVGLAIIHFVTRGNPYRSFILWGLYFALLYFNTFLLLAIAAIGLAEPVSPLKRRFGPPPSGGPGGRGPPASRPPRGDG